jgi:SAM-dependent methyltransferase
VTVNLSSRWSAADYAANAAFVPELGAAALALLDPQPGELILDLGCGDGTLTRQIAAAGARVIGLDASPDMIEAARANGVDAFVADAESLDLEEQAKRFGSFDAVFSNAALHWMLDAPAVASGVFDLLRAGGRFAGEMGGSGNLALLRGAIRDELAARGRALPADELQWYPDPAEFRAIYGAAGFADIEAELIERPTPLPAGIAGWLRTFRTGLLDLAGLPEEERPDFAAAVERRLAPRLLRPDGAWVADYVRLRFLMRKPG